MVGNLIVRGLIVGVLAGILAFAWAKLVGEPPLDLAIAYEESMGGEEADAAMAAEEEEALVSRGTQSTIGLLTGTVVLGAGFGGLFGVLFALGNGRIGRLTPWQTSVLLSVIAFATIHLIPWFKYPSNPPASTIDDTVPYRTAMYLLMLAISIVATVGAVWLQRRLARRHGGWDASLIAAGVYVVVIAVSYIAMPSIVETPADFPATVFWDFRIASLGTQVVLWAAIGVIFGYVVERMPARGRAPAVSPARS